MRQMRDGAVWPVSWSVPACCCPSRGLRSAHHSAAMFDEKKTVTVEGVVKEFQFTNPHSWLLVDVTDKNGKVMTWGFEAEGPSTLQRAGIRPSDSPAGHEADHHRATR